MSDGNILVTFESLEAAATDVDASVANIDNQLSDLKSYLAPMVSTWTGAASENYQVLQQRWDKALNDLNLVLHQIATDLRTTSENYQVTESANAQVWE